MPWLFRKSKKVAPGVRVNLGKRGPSVSLGGRGAGVTVGRRGVTRRVSLPGTGLSFRSKAQGCTLFLLLPLLVVALGVACSSSTETKPTPQVAKTEVPAAAGVLAAPTATEVSATPAATGARATQGANLRAGPGTGYAKTGGVEAGAALEVVGQNAAGDWLKLASGAWIAGFLVEGAPEGLPVVEDIPPLTAQATVTPAIGRGAPSASGSSCDCSGNTLNCDDFADPWGAQACYLRCKELAGQDVHELDRDKDGRACEWEN